MNLKQARFILGERPELEMAMNITQEIRNSGYTHVYLLYLDGPGIVPIEWSIGISWLPEQIPFQDFLNYIDPQKFDDVLIALSIYHGDFQQQDPIKVWDSLENLSRKTLPEPFQSILAEGRGALLTDLQLLKLIRVFVRCANRSNQLRKDIGAKRATAWYELSQYQVTENHTLIDLIEERTIMGIASIPNYPAARVIWDALVRAKSVLK